MDRLAELGLALGADVPVFVRGHNAWAEGVGEQLTAMSLPPAWYVLVNPGVHAATASLSITGFDARRQTRDNSGLPSGNVLDNAFEPVLRRCEPAIEADKLAALSSIGTPRLTGSGSACFVEFATREAR